MGQLVDLAKAILSNAELIERELGDSHHSLSFEVDSLDDLPPELHATQSRILELTDELGDLVQGPRKFFQSFVHEHFRSASVQFIVRFQLAKLVPLHGTATFSELAEKIGHTEDIVTRLLRHAMTYRVFTETRDGKVAHTAASRLLAVDEVMGDFLQTVFDSILPAASRTIDALDRWPDLQEPNRSGHNIAKNTDNPFFATIGEDPARVRRFANMMKSLQDLPSLSLHYLVENLDLSAARKLVDIGGSSGIVALALARKHPGLHCIVQDQAHVVDSHSAHIADDLSARITFMAHNFFHQQPVGDADVYYLRWILHDWSDSYAIQIIRNIVPAMKPGARLVINDAVVPGLHEVPLFQQHMIRCLDLEMLAIQNGRERDEGNWRRILQQADSRLVLREVCRPPGSLLAILVITM